MSAQGYTNKRRILAEASLRKTQYPGSIGLNNNPLYAAINCKPDFSKLTYLINRCCIRTIPLRSAAVEILLYILRGGGASTQSNGTVSGGGASMIATEIVSGGGASTQSTATASGGTATTT